MFFHIFVVLDNNHCNAIFSADSLLCFMLNAKYDVQNNEPPNLW